jgi:hypothetical protein
MPCLYISEVICYVKSNIGNMKLSEEIHDHFTCHKLDLHIQFCRTTLFKNNVANVGIKLYNKLPNKIKELEKLQQFKRKLEYFYCDTFFILWMSVCLAKYFLFVFYYACVVILVHLSKKMYLN